MDYDQNNIFAKIIKGEMPASVIFEDEEILAFQDINPIADIHFLVIPKKSYVSYSDFLAKAESNEISSFFQKIDLIATQVIGEKPQYKIVTNNGEKAGQIIFHFHCHIISGQIKGKY